MDGVSVRSVDTAPPGAPQTPCKTKTEPPTDRHHGRPVSAVTTQSTTGSLTSPPAGQPSAGLPSPMSVKAGAKTVLTNLARGGSRGTGAQDRVAMTAEEAQSEINGLASKDRD
eukprot:4857845-Alexandrium_andersonii.AAC.1